MVLVRFECGVVLFRFQSVVVLVGCQSFLLLVPTSRVWMEITNKNSWVYPAVRTVICQRNYSQRFSHDKSQKRSPWQLTSYLHRLLLQSRLIARSRDTSPAPSSPSHAHTGNIRTVRPTVYGDGGGDDGDDVLYNDC